MMPVALRKESVDRNPELYKALSNVRVALRKESVDRNGSIAAYPSGGFASLSARRAWIEILISSRKVCLTCRRSPQGERG